MTEDPMRERLAIRLGELRREYAAGEQQLAALEARKAELAQTLLRISGAIQVLEETLTDSPTLANAAE
jgi:flagellar biosynthesis chaperone FliJ